MKQRVLITPIMLAVFCLPNTLAAQPGNAMRNCKRQASTATNAAMSDISAQKDQDTGKGGYRILWDARRPNGRTVSGFCDVNQAGGIVGFEQTSGGGGQVARIQASISGGGGDGKCTFEVEVDGVAEVEIQGDRGILRTVSGNPARWRRLDCNQPLPGNSTDFRFKGIDGRGSQNLVRDPNSNRGRAVVRLEDPKNGSEGYTGDIMWRN